MYQRAIKKYILKELFQLLLNDFITMLLFYIIELQIMFRNSDS